MSGISRGCGLGKLILCGEHAVVYGHPALAFAVDRSTTVELARTSGPRTLDAPGVDDPRLERALDAILPDRGVAVRIRSEIPIGRGMGSSAAMAVAAVRALAELEGLDPPDPDACFEQALALERVFHGNPSGLDVAVAARGGFLMYRRGPPVAIEPVDTSVPWKVVVLDTGLAGDTAQLVAGVAARRPAIDPVLERIGRLVEQARSELDNLEALGELLRENQRHLRTIGVSTPDIDRLVELAEGAGAAAAKLSGAGGGGVVLALVDDPEPVLRAARQARVPAFACGVGECA